MTLKQSTSDWLVPQLHRIPALRAIAKQFLRGSTLHQPFHGAVVEDIQGQILNSAQEDNFTQAIAKW